MLKKVQGMVVLAIVCLTGYLVYGMYDTEINQWIGNVKNQVENTADLGEIQDFTKNTEAKEEKPKEETKEAISLPSHYDDRESGRSPVVKNQGDLGTCWAVTASSSLESALLPKENLVFSADHISLRNGYGKSQEEGGAYTMSMAYLAGWMGPVLEADDPYGDGQSPEGLSPVKHVQEIQMIRDKDIEAVKEMVYQNGSVQSSFYMDMDSTAHTSVYYNQFSYAYCYQGDQEPNHDVLIIGWDDAYPKENFAVNVKKDGAFICQNSWGSQFGENGIFYVSYEDELIGSYCVGYTRIENTDNYDHLYQTDLCGWIGQVGYEMEECYFANAYESQQDESVRAVGFYATDENTQYTVYVADTFQNSFSLVGQKIAAQGTLKRSGYYTVDLDDPVPVKAGQKFAVIVKIKTPGSDYPVATEYRADESTQNVTIEDGEGYISTNGIAWKNTEDNYSCNVCLKAYTVEN